LKLVIRSVSVWGHPNIRTWEPSDPGVMTEVVHLDIGPKSGKGADAFTLRIATPAGLSSLNSKDGIVATRPLLVMSRYDFGDLWRWLEKIVSECEAESWPASVQRLQRYFDWEFEGYREI